MAEREAEETEKEKLAKAYNSCVSYYNAISSLSQNEEYAEKIQAIARTNASLAAVKEKEALADAYNASVTYVKTISSLSENVVYVQAVQKLAEERYRERLAEAKTVSETYLNTISSLSHNKEYVQNVQTIAKENADRRIQEAKEAQIAEAQKEAERINKYINIVNRVINYVSCSTNDANGMANVEVNTQTGTLQVLQSKSCQSVLARKLAKWGTKTADEIKSATREWLEELIPDAMGKDYIVADKMALVNVVVDFVFSIFALPELALNTIPELRTRLIITFAEGTQKEDADAIIAGIQKLIEEKLINVSGPERYENIMTVVYDILCGKLLDSLVVSAKCEKVTSKADDVSDLVKKADDIADNVDDIADDIEKYTDDVIEGGSGSVNTLTNAQKSRLNSLENTINDHLTEGDFSGTLRDLQGNPVPNGNGGFFDHLGEMKDSYAALNKIKRGLEGSLKNPNLSEIDKGLLEEGLNKANSYIDRIQELFGPYGGID